MHPHSSGHLVPRRVTWRLLALQAQLLAEPAPDRRARWKVAARARNCLTAAADLERVDVSAATTRMSAGDVFGPLCDFPALAWLPGELSKDDLLVHRLAVPCNPWVEEGHICASCGEGVLCDCTVSDLIE